jgi:hypothetical protein
MTVLKQHPRHSRESGNPVTLAERLKRLFLYHGKLNEIPAFARMTFGGGRMTFGGGGRVKVLKQTPSFPRKRESPNASRGPKYPLLTG